MRMHLVQLPIYTPVILTEWSENMKLGADWSIWSPEINVCGMEDWDVLVNLASDHTQTRPSSPP